MSWLNKLIEKQKAAVSEAPAALAKKDILHGTGIDKRMASRQETALEKQVAATKPASGFLSLLNKQAIKQEIKAPQEPKIPPQGPVVSIPIPVKDTDFQFDHSQLAAIKGISEQKYACLIGAAGTGKTTVTKEIIKRLEATTPTIDLRDTRAYQQDEKRGQEPEYNVAICFCAFTGRAVQQMKRAIPKQYHPMCHTVHATLGYHPETYYNENTEKESMHFIPAFDRYNKLPYKIYVIDEAGMLPINLWNELLEAMVPDARVIMIGDINQLPPVQGRSVLGFAMTRWPTFELTTIHRQAQDNPIIMNAHKILQGHIPTRVPGKFDMIELNAGSTQAFNVVNQAVMKLHSAGSFNALEDALIVPQNKGDIGQVALNEKLVHYFNPPKKQDGITINQRILIKTGMTIVHYAPGDKVMLLQNDRERGLTNGMTGVVSAIVSNGAYQGDYGKGSDKHAEFDVNDFSLDPSEKEDDEAGTGETEDENKRQASHVLVVRFGTPSAAYLELKRKVQFLTETLEANSNTEGFARLVGTEFSEIKDTHEILQTIAALEYKLSKEDGGQEIEFRTAGHYKKVTHAYAFTCHKSQGGEYPTVLILCHAANIKMLNREWLYTAVTRAKNRVVLIYNNRGLLQALNLQRVKGATLQAKIKSFNDLQDKNDVTIPNLPKATKWDGGKK